VNNVDRSGFVVTPANVIGAVIGGLIGALGGYFLSRWLADKLSLKGWKRTVFIVGITAIITAGAAAIGYFIGPYVQKLGKSIIQAIRGLAKGSCCFIAGTLIETDKGKKAIENIEAGDYVYAMNPDSNEIALKKVVQTLCRKTNILCHVHFDDQEIVTTPEHPFWIKNFGWKNAKDLTYEDVLISQTGETFTISNVFVEILSSPVEVFNFEVEDFHTYFVGLNSIFVHNATCIKDFLKSPKKFSEVEKLLKEYGYERVRQNGSHVIFKDIATGKTIPVPNHGGKQIAIGTLRSILKMMGLL
jgi:predicted RNA binding protein YcfA (HicA-like mRNA interferase family)